MIWLRPQMINYYSDKDVKSGLYLKIDSLVDDEVKRACKEFCHWLRGQYVFPIRVTMYLKNTEYIVASDGERVSAIFYEPYDRMEYPRIRVSKGNYLLACNKHGKDNALAGILCSIAHELTHYFQWVRATNDSEEKEERQASRCADTILRAYAGTREHP